MNLNGMMGRMGRFLAGRLLKRAAHKNPAPLAGKDSRTGKADAPQAGKQARAARESVKRARKAAKLARRMSR